MPRPSVIALLALGAAACTFGAPGGSGSPDVGMSPGSTSGGADGGATIGGEDASATTTVGDGSADTSGGTNDPTDPTDPGSAGSVTGPGDGPGPGAAEVVFVQAPSFDAGDVPGDGTSTIALTLHNIGSGAATGLTGLPIDAPFAWEGDAFPGPTGTCTGILEAGAMCNVVVGTAAGFPGRFTRSIAIEYDTATGPENAAVDLTAGLVGESENLLVNGGFETGAVGGAPPSWVLESGQWHIRNDQVAAGTKSVFAGAPTGPSILVTYQDVSVAKFAEPLANGDLGFAITGSSRAYSAGNDPHRYRLRYIDAGGTPFSLAESPDVSPPAVWQAYEQAVYSPASTATVRVELVCTYVAGSVCSAWFDNLALRARYPVPPA